MKNIKMGNNISNPRGCPLPHFTLKMELKIRRSAQSLVFRLHLGVKHYINLVPRAHVSFGQRQDTELWNNPFQESKILGLPVLRRMRALVKDMMFRDKVDVNAY